jgi:hypothetical protein
MTNQEERYSNCLRGEAKCDVNSEIQCNVNSVVVVDLLLKGAPICYMLYVKLI